MVPHTVPWVRDHGGSERVHIGGRHPEDVRHPSTLVRDLFAFESIAWKFSRPGFRISDTRAPAVGNPEGRTPAASVGILSAPASPITSRPMASRSRIPSLTRSRSRSRSDLGLLAPGPALHEGVGDREHGGRIDAPVQGVRGPARSAPGVHLSCAQTCGEGVGELLGRLDVRARREVVAGPSSLRRALSQTTSWPGDRSAWRVAAVPTVTSRRVSRTMSCSRTRTVAGAPRPNPPHAATCRSRRLRMNSSPRTQCTRRQR